MDEMFIGSLVANEGPRAALIWMRAEARARRRSPRRNLKTPEYRALETIVAEAQERGDTPVVLGPSGIIEIRDPGVTARCEPIDIEPASLG